MLKSSKIFGLTLVTLFSVAAFMLLFHSAQAVQDVVLQEKINVTIESPTTNLVIEAATMDQMVVNATSVVITVSSGGNAVTITTVDRSQFNITGITDPGTQCTTVDSYIILPSQSAATAVTITPSGTCPIPTNALPLVLSATIPVDPDDKPIEPGDKEGQDKDENKEAIVSESQEVVKVDLGGAPISEGNLLSGSDGVRVYITNEHGYKRHIFNPAVFNMYAHFTWGGVKSTGQDVLDSYKVSNLYRAAGDYKIYSIEEQDGKVTKRHLDMTPAQFTAEGYDWNQVFIINDEERDYYETGSSVASTK